MCWYYLAVLPCKISDSSLENWLCFGRLKYLVFGMIWYFMVWYDVLVLPSSTTMQNFGHLTWKLTVLWPFKIFGIWYNLVFYGMVWHGMMCWYYLAVLPCKISDSSLENWLCFGRLKYLVFGMIWYFMVWYDVLVLPSSTTMQNFGHLIWKLTVLWPNRA